ncbi:hypothetical protein [Caldilinea aerophila]|jgi:hypothetical protein|uniref:Uncharacterized protein n=1 Tax=Caldilinea aerophila (strain DSM 14535 / JCM 11387 / NBRC 104270 / STL-6-O1) TaxID=926550 RepID=I0I7N7_CALAS|nr:hypothetical protein [Caldilinea aerophila]BAM01275.1 hypothetical protein CLDAP_32350 [Caldilinea aerophila DSM 14535 = NBRC 104270]
MAHVGAKQILSAARQEGYGVPCLLAGNLEILIGIEAFPSVLTGLITNWRGRLA